MKFSSESRAIIFLYLHSDVPTIFYLIRSQKSDWKLYRWLKILSAYLVDICLVDVR